MMENNCFKSLLIVLMLSIVGCSVDHAEWTESDISNIQHFYASRKANLSAIRLSNSSGDNMPMKEYINLQKTALFEAEQVRDDVLAKAYKGLVDPYRNLYQESLRLSIYAFIHRDNAASIKSSMLHDQWVDWFNANKRKIRIPSSN